MTKTYPYSAWTLSPSFKPKLVKLVRAYGSVRWDLAESGKAYCVADDLFPSKDAAITAGWERIHAQEARLDKQYAVLDKKRAALAKAAQEAA